MNHTTATGETDAPEADGPAVSRRRLLRTAAAGAVGAVAGAAGGGGSVTTASAAAQDGGPVPEGPTIALDTVAEGFEQPVDFATPSGDDRQFVVDRPGQVYVVNADGRREEPFIDVSGRMTPVEGEQGLLGLAFHPEFGSNGRFYLRYSAPSTDETPDSYSHTAVLAEFRANDDRTAGQLDTERRLLEVPEPQSNHNAGALGFGPDGYLYVPFGDGGRADDVGTGHAADWYANNGGNGQDVRETLLGSVLRIDVDSEEDGNPYAIPDGNPLVGEPGLNEQFAWGFRNPWRMSFSDGTLFVVDVGESNYEEVNIVEKGENYGWNVREGNHCYNTGSPADPPTVCPERTPPDVRGGEPLVDPIVEYPHVYEGNDVGLAVIGGHVYDGDAIPALQGRYVFGDYSESGGPCGSLFAAIPPVDDDGTWSLEELRVAGGPEGSLDAYLLGVGQDAAGECYALTTDVLGVDPSTTTGEVRKLVAETPTTGATTADPASTKSTATGDAKKAGTANDSGTRTGGEAASNAGGPGFGALAALGAVGSVAAAAIAQALADDRDGDDG